ncbi:uncharacterized protein [Mytilus edulis]|uniref:uncharacterized protein n=1 Tax=Mytilus edulis TaxID=6550 RepID=UPI0039EE4AB1
MFSEHEKKHHIHLETVYFISGIDKNDTEIHEMTDQIVRFAMQQSSWGQRRPMQWVPLQMQIGNMIMENINIITKEDLQKVNMLNNDLALNERQLNDFLLVQHSLGKLMYYDLPWLDNFIIIHPPALVNILRSFVTDEKFFPTKPNLRLILQTLSDTGRIYKTDLLKLWQQEHFHQYMPDQITREFVVQLLVHLDILIIPKAGKETSLSTDVYLVPCMIKAIRPLNFNSLDKQEGRTICLRYTLARHSIPTALAYKIIGAAVNAWPLKEENQKLCLYYQAAVFNVNEENELRIWLEGNQVIVYMTNQNLLLSVSPDIATSVQECLTKNLESSILFHYNSFGRKIKPQNVSHLYDIELGIPCGRNVCFKSSHEVMNIDSWVCRQGMEHGTRYLRYWIFDKKQTKCGHECKGLTDTELHTEPSDKHLVRLGSQIGMDSFREFYIYLGMEQKDLENIFSTYAGHSSEGKMSMALQQWKISQLDNLKDPTLKNLSVALEKAKIDSHLICQIFRENTELFDKADFKLQAIPSDIHLKELSNHIRNCPLQLGVELGLSFIEVEQSLFSFTKDLSGLVEDILKKWRKKSKVKTTIMLMMALQRVNAGGVRYLYDISKLLYAN